MIISGNGQTIPCPVCKAAIPFDTRQLIQGVQFSCPQCSVAVGLATESKGVVRQALDRFDKLRAQGGGLSTSRLAE